MQLHANAKLGPSGRLALCRAIEGGLSLKAAAAAFRVSPATAHRWWHRYLASGRSPRALLDRPSRPLRSPRQLSLEQEQPILRARLRDLHANRGVRGYGRVSSPNVVHATSAAEHSFASGVVPAVSGARSPRGQASRGGRVGVLASRPPR